MLQRKGSMKEYKMKPQNSEQELCIQCGLCCDNTLFNIVKLMEGEPEKFHQFRQRDVEGELYFELPCAFFKGCCSIYDQELPTICRSFRCKVLKDFSDNALTKERAEAIIHQTIADRNIIVAKFEELTGEKATFRQIVKKLETLNEQDDLRGELKVLLLKVELLDIQLAKHFRSEERFNELYKLEDE